MAVKRMSGGRTELVVGGEDEKVLSPSAACRMRSARRASSEGVPIDSECKSLKVSFSSLNSRKRTCLLRRRATVQKPALIEGHANEQGD